MLQCMDVRKKICNGTKSPADLSVLVLRSHLLKYLMPIYPNPKRFEVTRFFIGAIYCRNFADPLDI